MHYLTGPEITTRQHPVTVSDLCGVEPLRDGLTISELLLVLEDVGLRAWVLIIAQRCYDCEE